MASTNDSTRPAAGSGHSDLYRLISRFDEAWQRGDRPSIPDFLEDAGGHASVLVELIHRDLKHRLESGEAARVEHYLEGFPELRDDTSSIMDLVATEYDVRKARDGEFPMAEYVARFPQMAANLISFLIAPKRRDHTLVLEKDQSKQVTETPGLQNTIIEPSLSAMIKTQEQAETLFHSDSKSDGEGQPAALRTNVPGYEILGELGRGGMGVVYKARQIKLKRLVALKMIISGQHAGQKDLLRFQGEAEVIANLNSPNIVQIYDVSEHEGFPYFALEYIDGGTLSDKVAGKPMDPVHAAQLMRSVAVAVHSAHQKGIVHRDLKPDNILLTTDGVPKITDFGLAKSVKSDSGRNTQTGTVMGTPGYMAPEQALGKTREVGPASDLYSLGAILYEMLTGRPPFKGETPVDTMLLVVSEDPTPLTQLNQAVPKDLETICLKCLQKEIEHRYGSTQELADELSRFLNNEPILAQPITRVERLVRWCKRNAAIVTVSSLAALLFMALGGALIYKINNPTQVTVLGPRGVGTLSLPGADGGEAVPVPQDESMAKLTAIEKELYENTPDQAWLHAKHAEIGQVLASKDPEPSPPSIERARWLDSQVRARFDDVPTRRQAADEIKQLLAQPTVHRPDRLCDAVTQLAQANPAVIPVPEALQILRTTAEQRADYGSYIKPFIRTLQSEQVRQKILQPNLDWKTLLNDCGEADPNDGWVRTAKVEAQLEGAAGNLSASQRSNAVLPLVEIPGDSPEGPYAGYVQALGMSATDSAKAVVKLVPLFQKEPLPQALAVAHRQKRAADILVNAALKQRSSNEINPFASPFASAAPEGVYHALQVASGLYQKANSPVPPELANNLALAAWFKKPQDVALARNLVDQGAKGNGDDALRLRVLKIKLDETRPSRRKAALLGYGELLPELAKYLEKNNVLWEPKKWLDLVVEPGIRVGEQLKIGPKSSYDERRALSQLYMRKGMLIGQDETIVASAPYQHMKDAYDRALSLDDKMKGAEWGRCIVKRDIAQMWLQQVNLEQFEQDAKNIQQADPNSAGSHYLLGFVRAEEARRAGRKDRPLVLKKLADAKSEFTQAINLLNDRPDPFKELPVYYMERCNIWITQSMWERDAKTRVRCLEEAVNDAKDALRREPENPDVANEQLGNAYEELAWREGSVDRYAEAVAAFDDARRKVGKSRYWIALARCKFKCLELEWPKSERPHAQFLPEALKQLETILDEAQKGDRKLEPVEKAEAYYYLGKLHALNKAAPEAEKAFDAVEALKTEAKARRWVSFALKDNAESLLKRAESVQDPSALKNLVAKVKAKAEEYSKLSVEDAARTSGRLLGGAALLEKKPAEALARYQEGFKKEVPRADEWTMRLGQELLTLLLDTKWKVDIRGKPGTDYESVAKLGDEFARLSDDAPMFRIGMYGLAGEAHARAADPDDRKQKDAHLQEAVKKLSIAVRGTQPGDNDGWRWRFELARVYRDLKDPKNQAKAYELAQEALKKGNVPGARKTELQKLMNELKPAGQ